MLSPSARERAARGMVKVVAGWEAIWESPLAVAGGEYTGPVLLMSGTQSPAASQWITQDCATIFREGRHQRIAGAGHFSMVTHAAAVARTVERFIAWAEVRDSGQQVAL
jgi:pimeloyl-ACP methyl ester carboxylesterase